MGNRYLIRGKEKRLESVDVFVDLRWENEGVYS